MTSSSLTRCPSCRAIVNANWTACLACRRPIETHSVRQTTGADRITAGSRIEWPGERAPRTAVVDFVHTDKDGTTWAFVTFSGGTWAAVNLRYAHVMHRKIESTS